METISITIPKEKETLIKTADYLRSLACVEVAEVVPVVTDAELSPQEEADATGQRIDDMVAAASEPAAPATAAPSGVAERDKNGLLWDVRIHASSKAVIADGTWRLKRGVSPELVEQVTAELSQGEEPVVETVQPVTAPAALAPVETPAPVAPAPPAPVAPAPPVETPAAIAPITVYTDLITLITDRAAPGTPGTLEPNDVLDALKACGADLVGAVSLPILADAKYVTYIPLVADELRYIWNTRG